MKLALLVAIWVAGCGGASNEDPDLGPPATVIARPISEGSVNPRLLRRFRPLRKHAPMSDAVLAARIELGKQLFFDPRLSRDGDVSCNSCHPLDRGGADGTKRSTGTDGAIGLRNTPTVYNAAWQVSYFWDGRASTLEFQVAGPLLGSNEMGLQDKKAVGEILRGIRGYAAPFRAAFPRDADPLGFENVTRAIAAFQRTLLTPSRWDRYLEGDRRALDRTELDGMKLFANLGCVSCHTGELVGGSMFAYVGIKSPWPNQLDQGRFALTGDEEDRMRFKVPTLRNVTRTAPYFHDGSVTELSRAVQMMARHQLGIEISERETTAIVAWLGTLAGESGMTVEAPELP
jgi:cytochrome c peroxidase